jgi:hypothetical protein
MRLKVSEFRMARQRSHCALRAQPADEASGATLAYIEGGRLVCPPGEARRKRFERDGSPETRKVKPPAGTLCTKPESEDCNALIRKLI